MLRLLGIVRDCTVHAIDGDFGSVQDFYFDVAEWTIRYLVVDTGGWLPGRQVVISPSAVTECNWEGRAFSLDLTKKQIENSPSVDTHQPVTRRHEHELAEHFRWPTWWGGTGAALMAVWASLTDPDAAEADKAEADLDSTRAMAGYHVLAGEETIGRIEDLVVDDATWRIRYLVVDTRECLRGHSVLLSSRWITALDWRESHIHVTPTAEQIRCAPVFDPAQPITREDEQSLCDHYGEPLSP